jgi:hypothetical protein
VETTFLIISVLINIVFVLYARWLIQIIRTKEEEVTVVSELVSAYISHLSSVHEMEMFYGDQTLKSLIDHGKDLVEKVEELDYVLYERDEESEEEEE